MILIELGRHIEQTKVGLCFAKSAQLKCSGIVISTPTDPSIFGENSPLKHMDNFLFKQVEMDGTSGWSRNHLTTNLFVIVDDKAKDEKRCIEGSILAENVEDIPGYEFSISPANKNMNIRKIANFVSSELKETLSKHVNDAGYLPIYQSRLRPVFDKESNHGDRLALDTLLSNVDLFFTLIKKSAHREDLRILGMGTRYYSSYDACDTCFEAISKNRLSLVEKLTSFAKGGGYNFVKKVPIPFYSLFYSTRPYKDGSYSISWEDPRDKKSWAILKGKILYEFPKGRGILKYPSYHFSLPDLGHPHNHLFSERISKQLNLLRHQIEMQQDKIYSYVHCFEPEGDLPICYK